MYELKGKLHLYKCMHSDNTEFKMFIYTQYATRNEFTSNSFYTFKQYWNSTNFAQMSTWQPILLKHRQIHRESIEMYM